MQSSSHSFLEDLARELWEKHKADFDKLYVILPSRRARIFLIEALKKVATEASWLPTIKSMEDFISEISSLQTADDLELLFDFYQVYKKIEGDKADSLEDFMGWGSMLLYDFNEIDRNLIDPKLLFGYLSEQKAAENWNFGNEELTEYQRKYLDFWNRFIVYHDGLKAVLEEKQKAYQGMLYKEALQRLKHGSDSLLKDELYCFAGFNAFTPAEKAIISEVKLNRKTLFYWDADQYYLSDKLMEAGQFLRPNLGNYESVKWISERLLNEEKEIKIYGISGNIGQAKLLGELLSANLTEKTDLKSKAVILADENLLIPVLESLPEACSPLNITMGYPVKQTAFYSLFYNFFQLFQNAKIKGSIYHRDLFSFMEAPLFGKLHDSGKLKAFLQKLRSEQIIYFSMEKLADELGQELGFIFDGKTDTLEKALQLVELLREKAKLDTLELEILFHFYKLFKKFSELNRSIPLSGQALMNLYRQSVSRSQVSFIGEPLEGLQIMGVLESRTLDFDEIYLLSMNEGILPSGKSQNSLIPFNIKKEFNLPTYKEKDAIFAYHFYRLLQRAKKVHLIYNSGVDPLSGGEKSRFIEQLLYEMPLKNPAVIIEEIRVESEQKQEKLGEEQIKKSEAVIDKIKEKISSGLSASALNTYLTCPLDFYYKYVLGLREDQGQDPEEEMEAALFGNILHDCLEKLYEPADQSEYKITEERIEGFKDNLEMELIQTFKRNGVGQWKSGKNKLVFEVCKHYLEQFLNWEKERVQHKEVIISGIEDEIKWSTSIDLQNGEPLPLTLKGKIDRIESEAGEFRILDYKSGNVDPGKLKIKAVEDILEREDGKFSQLIQLGIYKLLYRSKYQASVDAGIISLKDIKQGILFSEGFDEEDCLMLIRRVIEQMLSKDEVIRHNPKAKYCSFCKDVEKSKAH
jgi:RecB family exonuclease